MEYKRESQFTNHASKRVFEEVYIDEDMPNERANTANGSYMLRVPELFASDLSQEKAISPRRVMVEPKPHTFRACVQYVDPADDSILGTSNLITFTFTSANYLEDCLVYIRQKTGYTDENITYKIDFDFDKINGILKLWAVNSAGYAVKFRFRCMDYNNYLSLWTHTHRLLPGLRPSRSQVFYTY